MVEKAEMAELQAEMVVLLEAEAAVPVAVAVTYLYPQELLQILEQYVQLVAPVEMVEQVMLFNVNLKFKRR